MFLEVLEDGNILIETKTAELDSKYVLSINDSGTSFVSFTS